ncbi:hypothetical protein DB30_07880 [Enhygromyxa salina]|uniref:Uncharacterized protein n=1 Tax=Enhygromyxa salina TaxID=215803 RepID=A0A0C2D0J9_9BACT|nr:hypothetical protein [Enhygromyxa salina]KIG13672.1 hypothetical protein DB30_07880 [Enhygromyxa salina]
MNSPKDSRHTSPIALIGSMNSLCSFATPAMCIAPVGLEGRSLWLEERLQHPREVVSRAPVNLHHAWELAT